jgi:hypothetical protein
MILNDVLLFRFHPIYNKDITGHYYMIVTVCLEKKILLAHFRHKLQKWSVIVLNKVSSFLFLIKNPMWSP